MIIFCLKTNMNQYVLRFIVMKPAFGNKYLIFIDHINQPVLFIYPE